MAATATTAVLDRSAPDALIVAPMADGRTVVGPTVRDGAIALAELSDKRRGRTAPRPTAPPARRRRNDRTATAAVRGAAERMGRSMPPVDPRALMGASLTAAHWDDVAVRCLTCGNCTLVCPTCFCTTTEEVTDLTGDHTERRQRWDSCFDLDFFRLHDGPVRASARSRHRQWLTHKLSTWYDQFGSSGCVGCGRCAAWCPAAIDITKEVAALDTKLSAIREEPRQ